MLSVIVVENGTTQETLAASLRTIRLASPQSEIILAGTAPMEGAAHISLEGTTRGAALRRAIASARGEKIVLLDSRLNLSPAECAELLTAMQDTGSNTLTYAPLEIDGEYVELPELTAGGMIALIAESAYWPVTALSAAKTYFEELVPVDGDNYTELAAVLMVGAAARDSALLPGAFTISSDSTDLLQACRLSALSRARLLNTVISLCNIEDLFPQHAWDSFEEEAAAACYHTLAGLFIRFGDLETAKECLTFSDRLEDSPRSQALKALISLERGETLGAVANLVSSLQQYETRKKSRDEHYLNFTPEDLEAVTANLNMGLQALNKRDNEGAAEHFAEAVFSFDGFYREIGVDKLLN